MQQILGLVNLVLLLPENVIVPIHERFAMLDSNFDTLFLLQPEGTVIHLIYLISNAGVYLLLHFKLSSLSVVEESVCCLVKHLFVSLALLGRDQVVATFCLVKFLLKIVFGLLDIAHLFCRDILCEVRRPFEQVLHVLFFFQKLVESLLFVKNQLFFLTESVLLGQKVGLCENVVHGVGYFGLERLVWDW